MTVVPEKDATHTEDQDALESSNIPDSQDSDSSNKDTGSNIQSGGNSIPLPYAAFQKIKPSVSARIAGANKIKISWKKISGAQKYSIFYTASPKKGYRFLKTVSGASYTASKLKTKRTYYFKVKASVVVNGRTINTDYSNAISKKAVGKPPKPKLKAKVSGNMLVLKWRKLSGVKNIVVYRSVNNGKYKAIRQVSGKSSSCKLSIANYSRAKSYRFFIKSYYLKDGVKIWSSDSKCRVLRGK